MDKLDELLKIKELLDSGIITESDFKRKKDELLKSNNEISKIQKKGEIIIGDNEKECTNCKCIIDKESEICKFCDYDFINKRISEKRVIPIESNTNLKKYISIFLVAIVFIFLITIAFTGTRSNNSEINNETPKADTTKVDIIKTSSDTTSVISKNADPTEPSAEYESEESDDNNITNNISSQSVQDFMIGYYHDICNNNLDVSTYFPNNVNQFITLKNTTSDKIDYQINTVAKKEFRNAKINIISDVEEVNLDSNDGNRYFKFSILFEAFRNSKNKNTSCDVDIEIGLNSDFKIVSYKEMKYYNYKSF